MEGRGICSLGEKVVCRQRRTWYFPRGHMCTPQLWGRVKATHGQPRRLCCSRADNHKATVGSDVPPWGPHASTNWNHGSECSLIPAQMCNLKNTTGDHPVEQARDGIPSVHRAFLRQHCTSLSWVLVIWEKSVRSMPWTHYKYSSRQRKTLTEYRVRWGPRRCLWE